MIFKSTTDEKVTWNVDSTSITPFALLEQLEPRILLSGDGLLSITPDPLDSLLDTSPQIVQYAELLETNEQAEEAEKQVHSELSNANIYEPLLTLSVDEAEDVGPVSGDAEITETNVTADDLDTAEESLLLSVVENYAYPENVTNNSEELSSDLKVSTGYDDTTERLTKTLLAANPPPVFPSEIISTEFAVDTAITNEQLVPIIEEAINRLSAVELITDSSLRLDNVQFQIADLPTGILAQVTGDVVIIDSTASGFGWFIDSKPTDDTEFGSRTSNGQLIASQESSAYSQIDLLSVISHELGHVLGLDDVDPSADNGSLMTATLGPGARRLLSQSDTSLQESEAVSTAYATVDLLATIESYLASNETGSIIVAEAKLGGFIDLFTLTLDFSDIGYSDGSYISGIVGIETQTGELFPGSSAYVSISDNDGDDISIGGDYNPGTGQFSLTLEKFDLNILSVLTASTENVTIEYNPAGASNQTLVTIGDFEMVLLVLDNTTVQVNNLIIRADGFSIDNASLDVASVTWLETLELSNFNLTFTDVNFSTTGPALSGTISVSTSTIKLFPSQSFFTTEITTFSGSYDLGTSALSLSVESLKVAFSDVLLLDLGNTSFSMDALAGTFSVSIASGTLSSPRFTDLPSISVTNLLIDQDGFSFDNVTLSPTDINIASLLTVTQLGMQIDGFSYDASSSDITGTVSFTAVGIVLFAGVDIFDTTVTGFNGSYNLETTELTLGASSLNIGFGSSGNEILLIAATEIAFSLDQPSGTFSFSANTVNMSSPQFADLPQVAVTGLLINQDQVSFDSATLGPIDFVIGSVLTIDDFEIVVTNFNYSISSSTLSGTIGFGFISVDIFPGQTLFTAQIVNFSGSYDIVNQSLNISANSVMIQISDLLKVTATGIEININPFSMSFTEITVTSPKFPDISGTLTELEITETGFSLGSAILSYGGDISIGPLTVNGLGIGIMNYAYSSETPEPFSGSILFYSGGASLVMGGSFSAVISDTDADGRAVSATLNFEGGAFKDLQFMVDKLEVKIGTFLIFTTTGVDLDTGAVNNEFIISFSSISAQVKVGSLSLKGTAKNFGITADGDLAVIPGETFGVIIEIGGADGSAFNWPSWLPIKINAIGIEFDFAELAVNPLDFTFILSASVSGLPAVAGLEFSGTIEGLRIRPGLLLEGKFPVVDIASIGVSVKGELFGGEINAALIGGILKIAETSSENYEVIEPTDTDTEVHARVLFMGVQGGFSMPGLGGLTIRFALSELGPLGVFINIEVPGGIVLEPHIGLAVNDFAAGVEFFKSLPSIDDPLRLRDPEFSVSSTVSADTWLAGVKGQVFDQYVAMQSNPNLPGFLAAFTSPMLIKGSAKIYTIYTSQQVFNGQVDLILSTDGKFLISGKLNFAADNITISGKLYADLSNIFNGDVTVLFLADIPEQVRLLSIDGKLKMGFRDESGQEVEIPVVISDPVDTNAETIADLIFPSNGETVDVGVLNSNLSDGSHYIDVRFQPGLNQSLDYESILDGTNEFYLYLYPLDGTSISVSVNDPLPFETAVISGVAEDTVLSGTQAELISLCQSRGIQSFRYTIDESGFEWVPGEVLVMFFVGSGESETFTILGPTADISNLSNGGRIEISEFDDHMYFDVTFMPTKTDGAIVSAAPSDIPILSGPGLGTISILGPPTSVEVSAMFPDGSMTLRYALSGQFDTGEVVITFDADTFSDSEGFGNTEQILSFIVDGATADLSNPSNGGSIGIDVLQGQGTIDVIFNSAWDFDIDAGTLNDGAPEIEITLSDGTKLSIADDPTGSYDLNGKTVYSYSFTGTLIPGTVKVVFLDESFADISALANIEEVETFFIEQPTVAFSNLADGATYLSSGFNDLATGQEVGLYEDFATDRYFELTLTPTNGADVDETTIQFTDLQTSGLSGISIYDFERVMEQIEDADDVMVDSPTNRFRFFFTGTFPDQGPTEVTFSMAAGAWEDTAENESGEMSITITIRKPATVLYLELEGGVTLDAAGLLPEPIFDIRGYVNFEAMLDIIEGPRFELEFGGTGQVVYLGNLGSMAGLFIVELPGIFEIGSPDDIDPDAITAGDLLADLGLTLEPSHFLYTIQLPKLWGVVKIETNFEMLKEIGIDLKAEALLEINLTAEVKTETLTLEGIPGDTFAQLAASSTLIDELNSDSLPGDLEALFTGDNALGSGYEVRTVIGGVLWRIIDSANEKQYFIQVQDVSDPDTDSPSELRFLIRGETQEFVLQSKMLRVMAYGQAIFRLPAYVNPEKTEMGPEWFRLTGAFSLKLSITSLEVFQNGQLTLSPAGYKILDIRSMAVLIIETVPIIGIAGKIKLGANIEIPGVLLSGNMEAYINTFGEDKIFEVPAFLQPVVGFDSVTIYAASPILNPDYDSEDANSDILIEAGVTTSLIFADENPDTITRNDGGDWIADGFTVGQRIIVSGSNDNDSTYTIATLSPTVITVESEETLVAEGPVQCTVAAEPAAYLTIAARADLFLLDDVIMLSGAFRLSLTTEILEVRASVATSIIVPGLPDPLFELHGKAAFAIDADGLYGYADLYVDSTLPPPVFDIGFVFDAEFVLEFNIASVAKDIQTYEFDKTNGNKLDLVTVTLPALTLHLVAGGTLSFDLSDSSASFVLAGQFEFLFAPLLLEIQAEVFVTGGSLLNANAAGAFQLSPEEQEVKLIGFIQVNVDAGDNIGGTDLTEITGADFHMSLELAFYINTGVDDVVLNGVTLTGGEVKLEASGYLELSIGGVAGFRIEGSLLVQANNGDFAVEVHGVLSAELLGVTLVRLNVDGGLIITDISTDASVVVYVIAGRLDITAGAGAILDGNGFSFDAAMSLEVNTTGLWVDLNGDGEENAGDLEAGIYARIHADGELSLQAGGNTGFKLDGLFNMEFGTNGLLIAAEADFLAQVVGITILKLHADGALLINNLGIAAHIKLSLGLDAIIDGTGFSFHGAFIFELNTTDQYIAQIGDVDVNLAAGPYIRLSITDDDTGGAAYLQLSLLGSSVNCFRLEGGLTIEANNSGLQVAANGSLKAVFAGIELLSIDAEGALLINQYGIAAKISLDASAGISGTGFMLTGSFLLELNTTNRFISSIAGQQVNLAAGSYIRIDIASSLEILSILTINGSFKLEIGTTGLNLDVDAKLSIFSVSFDVDAILVINSEGIVLRTSLSLTTASSFIPFDNFKISGTLILEVNTTDGLAEIDGVEIPAETARISVLNGELNILGLKATGSIIISVDSSGFEFVVPSNAPLTLKVGPITAELFGYIKSSGFSFTATADFYTTAGSAYLDAEAEIRLSNSEFYFYIEGSAGLKIGKVNISVSASGEVKITGTKLSLSVRGCVNVLVGKICATVTFSIGTVSLPGAAQTTPEPVLATRLSNGTLRLNIGSFAFVRGAGYSDIEDETFYVRHDGGTASGETVIVSAFGFSQKYSNIKSILVSDAASGNDFVQIGTSILVNAVMNGGVGNDSLIYLGSGKATINGGAGDDYLQVAKGNNNILNGSTGNDRLVGGSGKDTLNGGSGDDTLSGGGGNDTLNGGTGLDTIYGNGGNDIITGGAGNDEIYGHTGNDTINGDAGDDYIEGNEGQDTIHGNAGLDVIHGGTGSDIIYGDENRDLIYGNSGNDELHGGSGNDDIYGSTGDDTIYGDSGNDLIYGNEDDDTIHGGSGEDVIYGGTGEDTIYGNGDNDVIEGNGGDDYIEGNEGSDTIHGNAGLDVIHGGTGSDIIYGDENRDLIYGNSGNDELHGGSGNDDIYGSTGDDTIYGDSGNDLIYGNEDDDQIHGGSGEDVIYGGTGEDTIYGNGDNDVIEGNGGDDYIEGNEGSDTIHGNAGLDVIHGGTGSDIIYGDENRDLIYGNSGNDELHGGSGNDDIYGSTGDDTIYGDSGNDLIYGNEDDDQIHGGSGEDVIYGGTGEDTIYGNGDNDVIEGNGGDDYIEGNEGSDTIHGNAGLDVIHGGTGSDIIYGDENRDLIYGNSGNDELHGGSGNDDIYGSTGDDTIYGDSGNDLIYGNEDDDQIHGGSGEDVIYGGTGEDTIYGNGDNDVIEGNGGDDYIEGNEGSDTIHGNAGLDVIHGGTGSDIIYGDENRDLIYGNSGNDELHGGSGNDEIYGHTGNDTIYGDAGNDLIYGNEDDDTIHGGSGEDDIYGGTGEDTIYGDRDNDVIEGNEDSDIIYGNAGIDTIYGHEGNDILIGDDGSVGNSSATASGSSSTDYIYGHEGEDKIFGGGGSDYLYGFDEDTNDSGQQRDIIIGDGGTITYNGDKFDFNDVTRIEADSSSGGNDTIQGNEGDDIILAGAGADEDVQGNSGNDIILGDNGTINLSGGVLGDISTKNESTGGADKLWGDGGNDIIIGGPSRDEIYGEEDSDILIGDNGAVTGTTVESTVEGTDGEDDIYGQEGEDKILGGDKGDNLYGDKNAGEDASQKRDIIIGDGGKITYSGNKFSFDDVAKIEATSSSGGDDTIQGNEGNDVILGGADGDSILGQTGTDTILGDNGTVLLSSSQLVSINTTNESYGGADYIEGNENDDIIIGGVNGSSDTLYGNAGDDIILGDNGFIDFNADGDLSTLDLIRSFTDGLGGGDFIYGNAGEDTVLGGTGGDDIQGNDNSDILVGDNADIFMSGAVPGRLTILNSAVNKITTTDTGESTGGADTIIGNEYNDIIVGGVNGSSDILYGNNGDDVILGDNGLLDFAFGNTDLSTLDLIRSFTDGLGGGDFIYGNAGEDTVLGGTGGDDIQGNDNSDILVGDNADIFMSGAVPGRLTILNSAVNKITTTDTGESTGGADTIIGNEYNDIIVGGVNGSSDILYGNNGDDVILGDNGLLDFAFGNTDLSTLDLIRSFTDGLGGGDFIYGNAGSDVAMGGTAGDVIYGDDTNASAGALDGEDILLGDNGQIDLSSETVAEGRLQILDNNVEKIRTTDTTENTGGVDTIEGNAQSDVILGGVSGDTAYGDRSSPTSQSIVRDSNDVILGDNGYLDFNAGDNNLSTLDKVASNLDELGGIDTLSGNAGSDVAMGSTAGDVIYGDDINASAGASDGNDILLGDNGQIDLNGKDGQMHILGSAVETIQTTDPTQNTGGADTISGNAAGDFIAGGVMGDIIHGDADIPGVDDGNDHILGDNGRFEWGYQGSQAFAAIESGMIFDDSLDTLDLVTTNLPTAQPGGRDTIYGDDGSDIVLGGTDSDLLYGDDGDTTGSDQNNDVMFGDHGRLYPQHSSLPDFNSRNFFTIDTSDTDGGDGDQIFGEKGNDILLGQQGDDRMFGGSGDDDMIGGHNISGGIDELSLSEADINATVNPAINDIMDGGTGDDVLAGDNAAIWRTGSFDSPRFRVLVGDLMYIAYPNETYDDYLVKYGTPDITGDPQDDPDGSVGRTIELLDHNSTINDMTGPRPFGDDYIAGNADYDMLFGELGDDVLQGDGFIYDTEDTSGPSYQITVTDSGLPDTSEVLYFNIGESTTDGDDYIEGNGGADLIYGNLGQDDIIGGSSSLFGLDSGDERPDGSDRIFGGAGIRIGRNEVLHEDNHGDIILLDSHARDADMIVGDNGNIYRLVGTNGAPSGGYLTFNYDRDSDFGERGELRIIPRAVDIRLDYIPGIGDTLENGVIHGDDDIVNGESGDDFIHGMIGQDILYGDSKDDDIFGESGNDWISGGTGDDGILGDDGLIFTSRNIEQENAKDTELSEPLYGIDKVDEVNKEIATPGDIQLSIINVKDLLKKSVELTPFTLGGDDIIYGGFGSDFLHGGMGDDAISGAEALEVSAAQIEGQRVLFYYYDPFAEYDAAGGNVLGFEEYKTDEFALYDEYDPLRKVMLDEFGNLTGDGSGTEFLLNFEAFMDYNNQVETKIDDGNDVTFGDLGNDWLVGGTGQDRLYGGYGSDLMNADDNLDTNGGTNDIPDHAAFCGVNDILPEGLAIGADLVFGGAGRDILINNSGVDRLIDWVGEFNSYIVPYAPYGQFPVSRSMQPQIRCYLYDLSESDGADQSRNFDTGAEADRNGEPEGELGLVLQQDPDWKDQTGAPDDPQAGNIPGGKRDVMEVEDFNTNSAALFAIESGSWTVQRGQYQGQAIQGSEAISLFYVDEQLPGYYEVLATINANKDKAGFNSNGFIIFDYYSETDFKFAGIDIGTDKLQIGQRTADGWIIETQSNMRLKSGINYNMMIAVNGTTLTLVVNGSKSLSYTFDTRVIDGYSYGLNTGMVGVATNNAVARFDNIKVQKLPPAFTSEDTEDFSDGVANSFTEQTGLWTVNSGYYSGTGLSADPAITTIQLDAAPSSHVEFEAAVNTETFSGLIFDYYSETDFKFAAILQDTNQIVIGHRTSKGWYYDAVVDQKTKQGADYTLGISLHGNSVNLTLDGQIVLGYAFNSLINDGDLGFLSMNTANYFDDVLIRFQA